MRLPESQIELHLANRADGTMFRLPRLVPHSTGFLLTPPVRAFFLQHLAPRGAQPLVTGPAIRPHFSDRSFEATEHESRWPALAWNRSSRVFRAKLRIDRPSEAADIPPKTEQRPSDRGSPI